MLKYYQSNCCEVRSNVCCRHVKESWCVITSEMGFSNGYEQRCHLQQSSGDTWHALTALYHRSMNLSLSPPYEFLTVLKAVQLWYLLVLVNMAKNGLQNGNHRLWHLSFCPLFLSFFKKRLLSLWIKSVLESRGKGENRTFWFIAIAPYSSQLYSSKYPVFFPTLTISVLFPIWLWPNLTCMFKKMLLFMTC